MSKCHYESVQNIAIFIGDQNALKGRIVVRLSNLFKHFRDLMSKDLRIFFLTSSLQFLAILFLCSNDIHFRDLFGCHRKFGPKRQKGNHAGVLGLIFLKLQNGIFYYGWPFRDFFLNKLALEIFKFLPQLCFLFAKLSLVRSVR